MWGASRLAVFLSMSLMVAVLGADPAPAPSAPSTVSLLSVGMISPELPGEGWITEQPSGGGRGPDGPFVLLYFFAPGCGSCDAFTLHLKRLRASVRPGIIPIAVSDRPEEELSAFAKEDANSVYRVLRDPGKVFTRKFLGQSEVFPSYALLDGDGRLIWFDQGQERLPLIMELDRLLRPGGNLPLTGAGQGRNQSSLRSAALVVGIGHDPLSGKELRAPVSDAKAVALALTSAGCERVTLLTQDVSTLPASPITAERIRSELRTLSEALGSEGNLFFFFSGSGLQEGTNVQMSIRIFTTPGPQENVIELHEFASLIAKTGPRHLLLFDIGHEDAKTAFFSEQNPELSSTYPELAAIFSCGTRNDTSRLVEPGAGPGSTRFSRSLLEALTGAGDINRDGVLTAGEISRAIWLGMNDMNRHDPARQTPAFINPKKSTLRLILPPREAAP